MGNKHADSNRFAFIRSDWLFIQHYKQMDIYRNYLTNQQVEIYNLNRISQIQIKMYQWRKQHKHPNVIQILHFQIIDSYSQYICNNDYFAKVILQRTNSNINQIIQSFKKSVVNIILESLLGFQFLYKNFGAFKINFDMIRFDPNGFAKVWLNPNFSINVPNTIEIAIENTERNMVENIFRICEVQSKILLQRVKYMNFTQAINYLSHDQIKTCKSKTSSHSFYTPHTNHSSNSNKIPNATSEQRLKYIINYKSQKVEKSQNNYYDVHHNSIKMPSFTYSNPHQQYQKFQARPISNIVQQNQNNLNRRFNKTNYIYRPINISVLNKIEIKEQQNQKMKNTTNNASFYRKNEINLSSTPQLTLKNIVVSTQTNKKMGKPNEQQYKIKARQEKGIESNHTKIKSQQNFNFDPNIKIIKNPQQLLDESKKFTNIREIIDQQQFNQYILDKKKSIPTKIQCIENIIKQNSNTKILPHLLLLRFALLYDIKLFQILENCNGKIEMIHDSRILDNIEKIKNNEIYKFNQLNQKPSDMNHQQFNKISTLTNHIAENTSENWRKRENHRQYHNDLSNEGQNSKRPVTIQNFTSNKKPEQKNIIIQSLYDDKQIVRTKSKTYVLNKQQSDKISQQYKKSNKRIPSQRLYTQISRTKTKLSKRQTIAKIHQILQSQKLKRFQREQKFKQITQKITQKIPMKKETKNKKNDNSYLKELQLLLEDNNVLPVEKNRVNPFPNQDFKYKQHLSYNSKKKIIKQISLDKKYQPKAQFHQVIKQSNTISYEDLRLDLQKFMKNSQQEESKKNKNDAQKAINEKIKHKKNSFAKLKQQAAQILGF